MRLTSPPVLQNIIDRVVRRLQRFAPPEIVGLTANGLDDPVWREAPGSGQQRSFSQPFSETCLCVLRKHQERRHLLWQDLEDGLPLRALCLEKTPVVLDRKAH